MDIWKHGKYIDMWSLVHFLSGFLLALIFHKFNFGLLSAFLSSLVILIAWEVFEWIIKIIEPSVNVLFDIAIGISGFLLAAFLFYFKSVKFATHLLSIVFTAVLLLSAWGFYDYIKRGYR